MLSQTSWNGNPEIKDQRAKPIADSAAKIIEPITLLPTGSFQIRSNHSFAVIAIVLSF
jgi:hypothetical protein